MVEAERLFETDPGRFPFLKQVVPQHRSDIIVRRMVILWKEKKKRNL